MRLPLFPPDTKLINAYVGVRKQDGTVYYLQNGTPLHCHDENDIDSYRYISGMLVINGLCKASEIADALGVNRRNIERYAKQLRENGPHWFFNRADNRGKNHKMTAAVMAQVQSKLDNSQSVYSIAKEIGVSEGAIRYHIKKGSLKKSKSR